MDQEFIDIIAKMTKERGAEVLVDGTWKKWLADYAGGQYSKETNLLKQILNAKCAEYINSATDVLKRKQDVLVKLEDEENISPKKSAEYLDLLGMILKGDTSKCGVQAVPEEQSAPKPPGPAAWHISLNGQNEGPFDREGLAAKAAQGALTADTPVWKKGMTGWAAAGTVAELAAILAEAPPPPPKQTAPSQSPGAPKRHVSVPAGKVIAAPSQAPTASAVSVPDGMVWIAGGTFMMGSPASEAGRSGNETQHEVTVNGFYMGKYPVTQKEYQEMMGTNPSHVKGDMLPVEQVTWNDAVEYCNKRSQKEGLRLAYEVKKSFLFWGKLNWNRTTNGYRLPTEAEWEYACRAGTTTPYSSGSSVDTAGWHRDNSGRKTHPVGEKKANTWGLYDMHGNVWEWCWDWYGDYSSGAQTDPVGASSGSLRVRRGGSWINVATNLRSARRDSCVPDYLHYNLGFRLVRP